MNPFQFIVRREQHPASNGAEPGPAPGSPKATLVVSERQWAELRDHLLRPDGLEYVAYAVLGQPGEGGAPRYYLHRLCCMSAEQMRQQGPSIAEPTPEAVLDAFALYARSQGAAFMHLHSHPFCDRAEFSGVDDACLPPTRFDLFRYVDRMPDPRPHRYLRFVTGRAPDGFRGDAFGDARGALHRIGEVRVVGPSGIQRFRAARPGAPESAVPEAETDARLDRNVRWLGAHGQGRVTSAQVVVVGVGGAGVEVLRALRGLGVRRYTLIDHDRVELSNLNRLPWRLADVGRPKVEVAAEFLHAADPGIAVESIDAWVSHPRARQALAHADLIVAAVDDDEARLDIQDVAARHLVPLLELGAGIILGDDDRTVRRMGGQFRFYLPGGPCLVCMGLDPAQVVSRVTREIHAAAGYVRGTNESPGSVVTINAMLGGLAGDAAMRFLSGFSEPPTYVDFDLMGSRVRNFNFERKPNCPICGDDGIEGLGEARVAHMAPDLRALERHAAQRPPRQRRTAAPPMPGPPILHEAAAQCARTTPEEAAHDGAQSREP